MDRLLLTLGLTGVSMGLSATAPLAAPRVEPALTLALAAQEPDASELTTQARAFMKQGDYAKALPLLDKALKLNDKYANGYFERGRCYFEMKQLPQALADFTKVSELRPKVPVGWFNKGIVEKLQKNNAAALLSFSKVIELNVPTRANEPNFVLLSLKERALLHFDAKQLDRAILDLNKALEIDPKDALASQNLGYAYSIVEPPQLDKAIAAYTTALAGAADAQKLDIYLARAEIYLKQGKYAEEITDLSKALELRPADAGALNARGVAYFQLDKLAEAAADFDRAVAAKPAGALELQVLTNRAATSIKQKNFGKALQDYTTILTKDPNPKDVTIFKLRAAAYLNSTPPNFTGAIGDYDKYLAAKPTDAVAWKDKAAASFSAAGEKPGPLLDQAIVAADKAIALDAKLPEPFIIKGDALSFQGKFAEAIPAYNAYIALRPDDNAAYDVRGRAYFNEGKFKEATADFDKVLAKGANADVSKLRALAIAKTGGPEAIAALEKAAVESAKDPAIQSNLGAAYFNAMRYDDAVKAFQKAVELRQPTDRAYSDDLKNLANAHFQKWQKSKADADATAAVGAFDKVLGATPSDVDALSARADLNLSLKKYPAAIGDYTKLIPLAKPETLVAIHTNRAIAYINQPTPDYKSAVADYAEVIKRNPADPVAYNLRALAYIAQKDYASALPDLDKFLMLKPGDADALINRAAVHYNVGDKQRLGGDASKGVPAYDKAIADFTAYLATKPTDANALYLRGLSHYRKSDRKDKASLRAAITDLEAATKSKGDVADYFYYLGLAADNLGVAQEDIQEDMFKKAIEAYKKYVSMPDADKAELDRIKMRITQLQEAIGE